MQGIKIIKGADYYNYNDRLMDLRLFQLHH